MNLTVAYEPITELLRNAYAKGDSSSTNTKLYNLPSLSGSETPQMLLHPAQRQTRRRGSHGHARDKAVLKIVSPTIIHKTEVEVCASCRKRWIRCGPPCAVCSPVPERYAEWIDATRPAPQELSGLEGAALQNAIASDLMAYCRCSSCRPTRSVRQ
ncbi:MAG: hypothetical protein ACLSHC_12410 [Bilophila wadsworthia]